MIKCVSAGDQITGFVSYTLPTNVLDISATIPLNVYEAASDKLIPAKKTMCIKNPILFILRPSLLKLCLSKVCAGVVI